MITSGNDYKTKYLRVNHEDAYDSDVDEGPNAAAAFMANLSSTSATNSQVNEVHSNDNQIFDNVDYQLSQEMHQEEHLDSMLRLRLMTITIPYHQVSLETEALKMLPLRYLLANSDKVSMIAILTDLQTQLDGHAKVNQEKCLEIETLNNELLQCKQEICRLDTHKVKLDLENKVRQEQALERNSIAFLQSEKEKILSEKKDLADSYLDEIVCLKNANKDLLGTRNPGLGYIAKRAQPVLYDADTLLHPAHHPVRIWDSEDVLVHQVKELSGDQVYWLSANEIASQASNPATPATPFVHKSRPPSQVLFHFQQVNAVFHQFEVKTTAQGKWTLSGIRGSDQHHEGVDVVSLKCVLELGMVVVRFHCPFVGLSGCHDGGGNGFTKTSLITYLRDRHCNGDAQAITRQSLSTNLVVFEEAEFDSLASLCLLKTFRPRSNLECKSAIKRQRQEESIVNAIRSWSLPGGSLQIMRETLAESSPPLSDVDEEDIDLGERNIKQCKRNICDGHYTAAIRVLSSSGC
ncbi:hypothetical protein Tco_0132321 [Tanacetum coccineum]